MNLYSRYDFFLIWGHGIKYSDEIIQMIEETQEIGIKKFFYYRPKSISKFVKKVYSYDYAPLSHLKGKTKYLKKTPAEVLFIFVENYEPHEVMFGEGDFLHVESMTIKSLKERIRDKYNERKEDRRSENHVIHASDNEQQTDYMLKYLGFADGVNILKKTGLFHLPYHINQYSQFKLKNVKLADLYVNKIEDDGSTICIHIKESPHFRGITEDMSIYATYLKKNRGKLLQDYYSERKYNHIYQNFDYQEYLKSGAYVIIKKIKGVYIILDGAHRASVMLAKGIEEAAVIEVYV